LQPPNRERHARGRCDRRVVQHSRCQGCPECAMRIASVGTIAAYCTSVGPRRDANLSTLSQHLLSTILPTTNSTTKPYGSVSANFPSNFASDNWLAKFDFHLSDKHSFEFMYFIANSVVHDEDSAFVSAAFLTQQTATSSVGNVNWTWTPNSRWVNEAQFGRNTSSKPSFVGDHTVNPNKLRPEIRASPIRCISDAANLRHWRPRGRLPRWGAVPGRRFKGRKPTTSFRITFLIYWESMPLSLEARSSTITSLVAHWNTSRGFIRFGKGGASANSGAFNGATALEDFLLGYPNQGKLLQGNAERNISNQGYAPLCSRRLAHRAAPDPEPGSSL